MTTRPESYIGVSGVVSPEQQHQLEGAFQETGLASVRQLALGVKAVHKTQWLDIENKYGGMWYPVGEEGFQNAAKVSNRSIRIAQVYLDVDEVGDPGYRNAFSQRIVERGLEWIDGLQFDMLPWHSDPAMFDFLKDLKNKYPELMILLQCHKNTMEQYKPSQMAKTLAQHAEALDYLLFDSSHGTGTRLDINTLICYLYEAFSYQGLESTGIGVAGGLNSTVVREDLFVPAHVFPELSWDAEGQLHPVRADGTRPLNMQIVRGYFEASKDILS